MVLEKTITKNKFHRNDRRRLLTSTSTTNNTNENHFGRVNQEHCDDFRIIFIELKNRTKQTLKKKYLDIYRKSNRCICFGIVNSFNPHPSSRIPHQSEIFYIAPHAFGNTASTSSFSASAYSLIIEVSSQEFSIRQASSLVNGHFLGRHFWSFMSLAMHWSRMAQ